ncbi:unnamed protein product, partial [Callosobruchus maculatus]
HIASLRSPGRFASSVESCEAACRKSKVTTFLLGSFQPPTPSLACLDSS